MKPEASFQRVVEVNNYADFEYDILMKVICIYLLFTCHKK